MTYIFQRYLVGQTPFGVFTNLFDAADRETCGGVWYLSLHIGTWRFSWYGGTR